MTWGPNTAPGPGPAPGPGLDLPGVDVQVDGQSVWPPEGPGCAELVSCCQAAAAVHSPAQLTCQLMVAADPGNCPAALASFRQYLTEAGVAQPAACAP